MKKNFFIFTILSTILLISCSTENIETDVQGNLLTENIERGLDSYTNLIAGQNTDSGNVVITEIDGNLDVTYETEGDWVILETHLYVGSQEDMPATRPGNPKIGRFPYKTDHGDGVTTFTYSDLYELAINECTWVVAHAVVYNTVTHQEETAWANGEQVNGNNWAMWFEVCYEGGPS